jgi:hypothetical protein
MTLDQVTETVTLENTVAFVIPMAVLLKSKLITGMKNTFGNSLYSRGVPNTTYSHVHAPHLLWGSCRWKVGVSSHIRITVNAQLRSDTCLAKFE